MFFLRTPQTMTKKNDSRKHIRFFKLDIRLLCMALKYIKKKNSHKEQELSLFLFFLKSLLSRD